MRKVSIEHRAFFQRAAIALVSRLRIRPTLRPYVVGAGMICLLILCSFTSIGPSLERIWPYLVIPIMGLALIAADRAARTMPVLIWAQGVSLLAAGLIANRPSVQFLLLDVRSFALAAGLWMFGTACLCPRSIVVRRAYPVVAGIAMIAILLTPLSSEWIAWVTKEHVEIADIRKKGALHESELTRNYGADYLGLMRIIKEKTPEDAVIAFPGQNAFPIVGNPELSNYFVYPRTIESANVSPVPVMDISGASHIIGVGEGYRNVWPLFSVPVRAYYHTQALHRVQFGELTIKNERETTKVVPSDLQPWQTDADRSIESDMMGDDGTRTVTLMASQSVSDPWVTSVNLPLGQDFSVTVPVTTNAGKDPAMDEQVALLAEVRGPGGETALFASPPALQTTTAQTLLFQDLSRRATEYAQARGWRPGPLAVTHIGLELGWQIPFPTTKTNTLVVIERGDRVLPDGPDTFARLAGDAQRQLRAGNPNAAVGSYATSLLLRPNDLDGQLSLGEAFRIAARWKEGAQFFTALLDDYPNNPWIRYSLAVMRSNLGDITTARALLAPIVANGFIMQISRPPDAPKRAQARITAVATPSGYGYDYTPSTTLQFDTGDGSAGEVYASVNDGPESREFVGPSGTHILRPGRAPSRVVYRLYAGTDHTRLLDAVTITDLSISAPPMDTLWANFLDAQLAVESGDIATARATYQKIVTSYPGEYQNMANVALAALDRGK